MDKTGKTFVIAKANEFIYFGNFYKCQIEVAKGEKWEIIHQGGSFTVLKRGKVTIELCSQDFPRYFEQYAPEASTKKYCGCCKHWKIKGVQKIGDKPTTYGKCNKLSKSRLKVETKFYDYCSSEGLE